MNSERLLGGVPEVVLADGEDIEKPCRQIFVDVAGIIKIDIRPKTSATKSTIVHDFSSVNPWSCEGVILKVYEEYKSGSDVTASVYKDDGTTALGIKIVP